MHPTTTIVALSTPLGSGALAIVRLTGPEAEDIARKMARLSGPLIANKVSITKVYCAEELLDKVGLVFYKSPNSYTGEDVIEITCHGSIYIIERIIQECQRYGALPARPGEFTKRAYLNGKMDLLEAESVADLIFASTQNAHQIAMDHLGGYLGAELRGIRDHLIELIGTLELELDFNEQEPLYSPKILMTRALGSILKKTRKMLETYSYGKIIRLGAYVPIVGPPNSGKSSLLNALIEEERAIVTPYPGTTRDTIEETFTRGGYHFRLVDTAGLRATRNPIEKIGIERTYAMVKKADLILFIVDITARQQGLAQKIPSEKRIIIVLNKVDIASKRQIQRVEKKYSGYDNILVSAKQRTNIHELADMMVSQIKSAPFSNNEHIITQARHASAIKQFNRNIRRALVLFKRGRPVDMVAFELRAALEHIDLILGKTTNEDILNNIFGRFCIGK